MEKQIKILVAKPGLDGHDVGAKVVVRALMDAGFEIDACYGNFEQAPFDSTTAQEQVWIARKPS